MLSMMTASAVKRFPPRAASPKKNVPTVMARSHTLAEDSAPRRTYPSTRHHPTARMPPHAVGELAYDGEHFRWYANASQGSPRESAVDGVIGFGKVDKAHKHRGVLLPRQFLQASHQEHHADRRAVGSKSTLLLL